MEFFCYESLGAYIYPTLNSSTFSSKEEFFQKVQGTEISEESLSKYEGEKVYVPTVMGYREAEIKKLGDGWVGESENYLFFLVYEEEFSSSEKRWRCGGQANKRSLEKLTI